MKRYMVTCSNGDCRGIDAMTHRIVEIFKTPLLILYKEDNTNTPIAAFKEWVYFTIE